MSIFLSQYTYQENVFSTAVWTQVSYRSAFDNLRVFQSSCSPIICFLYVIGILLKMLFRAALCPLHFVKSIESIFGQNRLKHVLHKNGFRPNNFLYNCYALEEKMGVAYVRTCINGDAVGHNLKFFIQTLFFTSESVMEILNPFCVNCTELFLGQNNSIYFYRTWIHIG